MTDAAPDNGNGVKTKVDIAVINTKIDALQRLVEKMDGKIDTICDDNACRDEKFARLESKVDVIAGLNSALAVIGSVIAGWFGART